MVSWGSWTVTVWVGEGLAPESGEALGEALAVGEGLGLAVGEGLGLERSATCTVKVLVLPWKFTVTVWLPALLNTMGLQVKPWLTSVICLLVTTRTDRPVVSSLSPTV